MKSFFNLKTSSITIILLTVFLFYKDLDMGRYKNEGGYINNDVTFYYSYLPAILIHHDYSFKFIEDPKENYRKYIWPYVTENGRYVMKMSMGLSYLYMPFFLGAHGFAKIFHYPTTGFSLPYEFALMISSLFYLVLGLFMLRKILLKYFSEAVTALSIIVVVLGTNLLNYATFDAPMSHSYSFALIILFMYFSIKWHEKSTVSNSIIVGLMIGLISLVRPTNLIVSFFFIFYGIKNLIDFKSRIIYFFQKTHLIALIFFMAILVWLPQLLYWKAQTGSFLFYSYIGERFFFDSPKLIEVLFSYRKGWLVYSPLMIFSLIGFGFVYKFHKNFFLPIIIIFILHLYIISSWWCWWYGGSFGMRAMIDIYGLLIFPMASVFSYVKTYWLKSRIIILTIICSLLYYSIFNNYQYSKGIIHYDAMSEKAYWSIFLKKYKPDCFWDQIECIDYNIASKTGETVIIPCK